MNYVELLLGIDGVKSYFFLNGIIFERVVNFYMRNFGCRKSLMFVDLNMVKVCEERMSGNFSFSVFRFLGNENYRDVKFNFVFLLYRISSIFREDKSVLEILCGDSGLEKFL